MDQQNQELVQRIAREVIRVLQQTGAGAGVSPSAQSSTGSSLPTNSAHASEPRAHIHPPIGQCTGDYSKFPELAGRLYGQAQAGGAAAPAQPTPSVLPAVTADESMIAASHKASAQPALPTVVLTGVVTHAMLQAELAKSKTSPVHLAHDARLTPMANDLARQVAGRVTRLAQGASVSAASVAAKIQDLPWLWWIEGACPVVRDVTGQRAGRLRAVAAGQVEGQLGKVVREVGSAIRTKQAAGAILFVRSGARAVCFANRCASIRAILGTCGESVEQGVRELAANVLIVEYPHHGYRSVSAMVDRIMQQAPEPLPAVERELSDLHRCG